MFMQTFNLLCIARYIAMESYINESNITFLLSKYELNFNDNNIFLKYYISYR